MNEPGVSTSDSALTASSSLLLDEENKLVERLKKLSKSDETHLQQTAFIFHQLGKIYHKRSPDLTSVITSSIYYKAAIAKSPICENDIQENLNLLCRDVLALANANLPCADLIQKSKDVQDQVVKLKEGVARKLSKLRKIPNNAEGDILNKFQSDKGTTVQQLQNEILSNYKRIIIEVAIYCENVIGKSTSEFALIGLGLSGMNPIAPNPNFEYLLVLKKSTLNLKSKNSKTRWFHWFCVMFIMILMRIEENIIPNVAIILLDEDLSYHLQWYFDNSFLRNILFRAVQTKPSKMLEERHDETEELFSETKFLKSVNEMLLLFNHRETVKNGCISLYDVTTMVFLYKNKGIYDTMQKCLLQESKSDNSKKNFGKNLTAEMNNFLGNFASQPTLHSSSTEKALNLKQMNFHTFAHLLSGLGKLHNIHTSSCFDIVHHLAKNQTISEYAKHRLLFAIALNCEIQLKWKNGDLQIDSKELSDEEESEILKLVKSLGITSVKSYFQIILALQCFISKRLGLKQTRCFSDSKMFYLSNGLYFGVERYEINFTPPKLLDSITSSSGLDEFDVVLKSLEAIPIDMEDCDDFSFLDQQKSSMCNALAFQDLGILLYNLNCHRAALDCFRRCTEVYYPSMMSWSPQFMLLNINAPHNLLCEDKFLKNNCFVACSWAKIGKKKDATFYFEKALRFYECISENNCCSSDVADSLYFVGRCLIVLQRTEEAVDNFKRLLLIREAISENTKVDDKVAFACYWIFQCFMDLEMPDKAITFVKKMLQIKESMSLDVSRDEDVGDILFLVGQCLIKLKQSKEALASFEKMLQIKQKSSIDPTSDNDVANALFWIGRCFIDENQPHTAIKYFERVLEIKKKISIDVKFDKDISCTLYWIGQCLKIVKKLQEALSYFEKAFEIEKQTFVEGDENVFISDILNSICTCALDHTTSEHTNNSPKKQVFPKKLRNAPKTSFFSRWWSCESLRYQDNREAVGIFYENQ